MVVVVVVQVGWRDGGQIAEDWELVEGCRPVSDYSSLLWCFLLLTLLFRF